MGLFLPTTNISGGVNVIIKHCNILRNRGFDVFIINEDKTEEDIINKDGIIPVIEKYNTRLIYKYFNGKFMEYIRICEIIP